MEKTALRKKAKVAVGDPLGQLLQKFRPMLEQLGIAKQD